jgi:branched-chain amino acid transport system substrate-binding protein
MTSLRFVLVFSITLCLVQAAGAAKRYGPGVTDSEIKIGQTMPYSGPVSAWGTLGRAESAYFDSVNAQGGINGRKVRLLSLDDGYSPNRTVEQVRKLIEQENVLLLFSTFGTPTNTAIIKYVNAAHVPHLFIAALGSRWADPAHYPWSMALWQSPKTETGAYAHYLLKTRPNAKVGVLYQNDDYGKEYLETLKTALGARALTTVVATASYEVTDPSVKSQIIGLRDAGVDTLLSFASPKFASQAIRNVFELSWKPLHIVAQPGSSVGSVLKAAGFEKAVGLVSATFLKDPTDPQWRSDPAMKAWQAWMTAHYPNGDQTDWYNVFGYSLAQAMAYVLQRCGDELTRENALRIATHLTDVELPMLLPGIRISTAPDDYLPIKQVRLMQFDGKQWSLLPMQPGQ